MSKHVLYHATSKVNLASIQEQGLLISKADPAAKLKAVWMVSKSNIEWSILHCQRKHKVMLEDVVVIEVKVHHSTVTRFKRGFYRSSKDMAPSKLGQVIPGSTFGASVSE